MRIEEGWKKSGREGEMHRREGRISMVGDGQSIAAISCAVLCDDCLVVIVSICGLESGLV